jgi:RNA polymerase sigma-70 factor (ECF subfamily)
VIVHSGQLSGFAVTKRYLANGDGLTDAALLARVAQGDTHALGALYDRHGGTLYALAHAIEGNDELAEDVVAAAFGMVWGQAAELASAGHDIFAWLTSEVRRRSLVRRSGSGETVAVLGADDDPRSGSGAPGERIARALSGLPETERRALELAYFAGLTESQIARELGEPVQVIARYLRAAMERIRHAAVPGTDRLEPHAVTHL